MLRFLIAGRVSSNLAPASFAPLFRCVPGRLSGGVSCALSSCSGARPVTAPRPRCQFASTAVRRIYSTFLTIHLQGFSFHPGPCLWGSPASVCGKASRHRSASPTSAPSGHCAAVPPLYSKPVTTIRFLFPPTTVCPSPPPRSPCGSLCCAPFFVFLHHFTRSPSQRTHTRGLACDFHFKSVTQVPRSSLSFSMAASLVPREGR